MRTLSVGVVATLVSGCFGPASHVDSNASLSVSGVAQRQNGGGDGAAKVQLIRHPDALQTIGDALTIVGSLGLACLSGDDSLCQPYAKATTTSEGAYTFGPFRGADTQGSTGEALLFSAWLSGPAPTAPATAPAGLNADFYIQKTQVDVPALRLWETAGAEVDAGGMLSFSWPSLESSIGSAADDYRLQITTAKGQIIWSAATSGSATQVQIDPRVTQDFAGNRSTWAHRKIAGDGTDFDLTWYAPALAYATRGRTPLSRGKNCWLQGPSGPVQQSPCPLTDGDLATSLQPLPAPACPSGQMCAPPPQNNWVYVDLGAATPVTALVLYDVAFGPSSSATVEGSIDGAAWAPLAAPVQAKPYQLVSLSGTARFVRLRLADASAQFPAFGNSELAIF
ncbi:MAG TPA: discoidin domain-containing protein [Polyangia bacterium]|nr:discoidin domain-containing protein [Polyangia bacterium]